MSLDRLAIAQLLRDFADFLEAREAGRAEPPAPQSSLKKKKPARKRAPAPPPIPQPSELDMARAKAALRRVGYLVKP